MPIKWGPVTDQTLLLKILETSNIKVDSDAISASWPNDQDAPTPRAITERLHKIRAMAKPGGEGTPSSVPKGGKSAKSTPRKPRLSTKNGVKKTAGAKGKRRGKKNFESSDSDFSDDMSPSQTTKRGAAAAKAVAAFPEPVEMKPENNDNDNDNDNDATTPITDRAVEEVLDEVDEEI